ncbi:unnamed protein product [Symbiodinium sp. CCMP2456]|nr:unnamed protein product [Symbiodinium sp. CCMP2456]
MGCAHFSWKHPAVEGNIDVMISRSHSLEDANADFLASWICNVCSRSGVRSFYKPGLSGSAALDKGRRRLLRDALEVASCVAAVAVAVAIQTETQLASEVVWAAQHSKPIILLYDSSLPFDMPAWQDSFPELFPSHVVRYYGKGHEACADELMQAIESVKLASSSQAGGRQKAPSTSAAKTMSDNVMSDLSDSGSVEAQSCFSDEAWQAALERMRESQPSDLPKISFKGILRNRERWTLKQSARNAPSPFLEGEVQEAVRYVMRALPNASEEATLELLCAGVGVSERVVSASLRVLCVRMSGVTEPPQPDFVQEVFAWSLAALHRHVDSVDVCTFGMECLQISYGLLQSSGAKPMKISSVEAEHIVRAIRSFPSCRVLQRNGFSVLLQHLRNPDSFRVQDSAGSIALPGGGLARVLTREGVAEMALKAMDPGDSEFLREVCAVLQILAGSSRHVKELLFGTMTTWVRLLQSSGGESLTVLELLAALASGDDDGQEAVGQAQGIFESLYDCLKGPEPEQVQTRQVFTLLCLLTSRHSENKKRCCSTLNAGLLREAVRTCCSCQESPEVRLAAGGMLVNICSDPSNISTVSSVGALSAADALQSATGPAELQLQRCGAAIRLGCKTGSDPFRGDGSQWKTAAGPSSSGDPFAGLFAMRKSSQPIGGQKVRVAEAAAAPSRPPDEPDERALSEESRSAHRPEDRPRGPGWQRLPQHSSSSKKRSDSQEPMSPREEPENSASWGLGEWAPSGLAPPLSSYPGLSKDLWIGGKGEEQELDAEEVEKDADEELVSVRTQDQLHQDDTVEAQDPGLTRAAKQVSKGRTLRAQLDELRAQAPCPKPKPTGWFGRRPSGSSGFAPGPSSTVAEDRRARAVARENDMLVSQMALDASRPPLERGEVEMDFPVPANSGTLGKACPKLVQPKFSRPDKEGQVHRIPSNEKFKVSCLLEQGVLMDRGLQPDAQLRGVLITSLGRSSKWAEALSVLQESIFSLSTLCFNAAITACEKGQQWMQALAVLDALTAVRVPADTVSYSGAISACEKCRQWERALALLGQLQRCQLVPDTIACSAAISACEKSGRWQQALSVLSTMLEERARTDLVIFSAAISACEKGRKWQEALQLLRMALERFRPDITPYNAVISACAADGCNGWQMAVQLFSEALHTLHLSVDVLTGSSVIAACAEAREWRPALQLLKELQQEGVRLNIKVYNAAVTAASERPLIALQVVEEIDDSHLEPDVLTYMPPAEAIADNGFPPLQQQSQFAEVLASLVKATESALRESASQCAPTVLALDLLTDSGCFQACHGALQAQACRLILGPARPRLQNLMDASERREGHENEALRDPVLERHFSMGSMLTDEVLASSFPAGAAWRRPAVHQARSALQLCEEEVSFAGSVVSRGISAWSGCSLQCPSVTDFGLRGRLCAFGEADPDFRRLAPILVEHDRSQHAERQAMLLLLDEVNASIHGPKTCPDGADTLEKQGPMPGRIGGMKGVNGVEMVMPGGLDVTKKPTSLRTMRSSSSSMLTGVTGSPKWIKLDGIHDTFVRRVRRAGNAWIQTDQASVVIGVAITVQALLMGIDLELEFAAQLDQDEQSQLAGGALRERGGFAFYFVLTMDCLLYTIFTVEFFLRLRAVGIKFMRTALGVLDFILLLSAGGYIVLQLTDITLPGAMVGIVRTVRLLRVLRFVHILAIVPALALLVKGLVSTLITIMDAMILLGILSYVGALLCSEALGNATIPELQTFFGTIPLSFLTHIKLVLVEGWPEISDAMLQDSDYWSVYLIIFIFLSNFALLNLVTGVVCERVMELARQMPPVSADDKDFELEDLRDRITELFETASRQRRNYLSEGEYVKLLRSVPAREVLDDMKIALPSDTTRLTCLIDDDHNGKVTRMELQDGLLRLRGSRLDAVSRELQLMVRKRFWMSFTAINNADTQLEESVRDRMQSAGQKAMQQVDGIQAGFLHRLKRHCGKRTPEAKKWDNRLSNISSAMRALRWDEAAALLVKNRHHSWQDVPETEEFQVFFDCYETREEMLQRTFSGESEHRPRRWPLERRGSGELPRNRPLSLVPEAGFRTFAERASIRQLPEPTFRDDMPLLPEDVYEDLVPVLKEEVLDQWRRRMEEGDLDEQLQKQLHAGFPELEEWTSLSTVRRMLRASQGNLAQATPMLMKAIECRVRERELFQCMRCKAACDMRIIGRDRQNRPTIYISARSQTEPLRALIPQVFLAFEAATRLAQEDGQAILVADMIQLQPHLNMDLFAFKDLANNFGVVFADRLNCILIVDFSWVAQAVWSTLKPFLSERTQRKINFLSEAKARSFVSQNFSAATRDRIFSSFDINRDELSTQEDRFAHALRTAICDVPLGELRAADEAG